MLYLNIALCLIMSVLYAVSLKCSGSLRSEVNKKDHKLYFLYPLARLILTKTRLEQAIGHNTKAAEALTALHINHKPETERKLYWYNRVSLILMILFLFNLLSLINELPSGKKSGTLSEGSIERPEQGDGTKNVDLTVTITKEGKELGSAGSGRAAGGEKLSEQDLRQQESYREEINIRVDEREYSEEELNQAMEEGISLLKTEVLGRNQDFEHITEDLNFIGRIPGTSITVEWLPEDYKLINGDGHVENEELTEGQRVIGVTAVLTCQNARRDHSFTFTVRPRERSEKETLLKKLYLELQKQATGTGQEKSLKLPDSMEGYSLSWEEKEQENGILFIFLGILLAAVSWFLGDGELKKRMKLRENQMLMDYPEIINKFNLLLNAGMTIRQAWSKIAEDYAAKSKDEAAKRQYAYEEMLLTAHEIKLGVPEGNAYEQFGRRTGVLPFMKFGSLVSQNLKKGNKGLAELLMREALDAFEERKELAKRLGEEAGTKLLGPMMVMFMIVLIIIMIPAFLSFGI